MADGRIKTKTGENLPPCGTWCADAEGLPLEKRVDVVCSVKCKSPADADDPREIRPETYVYLDIVRFSRVIPDYVKIGYNIGAFDDRRIGIIAAGIGASNRG